MYTLLKRFLAWTVLACLPLVIAGCGDDGGGAGPTTNVSGVATVSGPVKAAQVQIFTLQANGNAGEQLGSAISGDDGRYTIPVPAAKVTPPLLVKVSGQANSTYTSKITGADVAFSAAESFHAVVDVLTADQTVAVNPLSEAAYRKLQQVLTDNPTLRADVKTVGATNSLVADLFNVSDILADPATNLANQAALLVIDQMIVDAGSNTTPVMNLINQAFADLADPLNPASSPGPAYQTYLTALTNAGNTVMADISLTSPQLAAAVQALLNAAQSPPPEPVWTDATPPSPPADLAATVETLTATSGAATLTWTASSDNIGVTGYEVYRDGSLIARVTSPTYRDATLIPGSTYTYFVIALDGAGNRSGQSNTVSAKANPVNLGVTASGHLSSDLMELLDLVAPSAPTGLNASTSALTATTSSVSLSWNPATDNKGISGYEVYRNGTKIATVTATIHTDAPVTSGQTYSYHVVAIDTAGNKSAASASVSVTPPTVNLDVTAGGQVIP